MLKFYNFLTFFVGFISPFFAQSADLDRDIRAQLAAVDLENRIILATEPQLAIWANHHELLFDSFSSPFDSNQANALLKKYAAERVFVSADYPQKTQFQTWAKTQELMVIELTILDKNPNMLLKDAVVGQSIVDGLRQKTAETLTIWWFMLAGLISGMLIYVLFSKIKKR
jgi:hypothetical protein